MIRNLSFNNPRRGKQPRANVFLRLGRMIRRKRVAYARAHAWSTLEQAKRQIARFEELAVRWGVPIDAVPQIPALPELPGEKWVNCLQGLGELREPVKPAPPVEGVPA